jgi:hypothetical protein
MSPKVIQHRAADLGTRRDRLPYFRRQGHHRLGERSNNDSAVGYGQPTSRLIGTADDGDQSD